MKNQNKPTIAELEALLEKQDEMEIEIKPDGSIHAVPKGTAKDSTPVVLTAKYAAAEFY